MAVGRRQQFAVVITRPHTRTDRKSPRPERLVNVRCRTDPFPFCVYNFHFKKTSLYTYLLSVLNDLHVGVY